MKVFKNKKLLFFKVISVLLFTFISLDFGIVKSNADAPLVGCRSSLVDWIRNANPQVVTDFIQQTYPVDNPNNNNTGTSVSWRGEYLSTAREHLIRWDSRGPNIIFSAGFHPFRTGARYAIQDANLWTYANNNTPSIFVGTTRVRRVNGRTTRWTPYSFNRGTIYAYDVFAPGGIDVNESLGSSYQYQHQHEIAFPGGINRRYVRSVVQYHNGRVVRVFTNPNFSPGGVYNIPRRRTTNRTPVLEWRENHPDGNNPDTSSRNTNDDDLMFGGNGGEDESLPDDENETVHIANGSHQITVPKKNDVVASTENKSNLIIENNRKPQTQWSFTYDADKDAYSIKNSSTQSTLNNKDFWRVKELKNDTFIFTNTNESTLLKLSGSEVSEQSWNGIDSEVPNDCQWNITTMDSQPLKDGYYQMNIKCDSNRFVSATSADSSKATPVVLEPYGPEDSKVWELTYNSDKKAYRISPVENVELALTWESKSGNKVSNYKFQNNSDQYWYLEPNEYADSYKLINYSDGLSLLDSNSSSTLCTVSKTNTAFNFTSYPLGLNSTKDTEPIVIGTEKHPDQVVDLPNGSYAPRIKTHSYTGAKNQIWKDIKKPYGYKMITHMFTSLDSSDYSTLTWDSSKGSNVIGFDGDHNDQNWRILRDPSGYYRFHNAADYKKVMTNNSNNQEVSVSDFKSDPYDRFATSDDDQLWNVSFTDQGVLSDGNYIFALKSNHKKVIDFTNNKLDLQHYLGQPSSVFDCKFYTEKGSAGRYRVSNRSSGTNGYSSEWQFEYLPDKGAFTIRDFKTNKLITSKNDHISYEDAINSDSQLWNIIPK